jgi:hypothetical protein
MLVTCHRFIAAFPQHDRTPSVKMKLAGQGIAHGPKEEAQQILQEIAQEYAGTPWGEEASVRLWHEFDRSRSRPDFGPSTVIHASRSRSRPDFGPQLQPVQALQVQDGLPSNLTPQIGAAYDAENLYLKLLLPLGGPWPSPDANEALRLFLDARGEMTDYQTFIVDSQGHREERGRSWHQRGEGIQPAEGWEGQVTREPESWTADLVIPFAKIGFRPEPGHRTWRFGFRWDSLSGQKFWRPSIPHATRPQDCGWLVFD